MPELPEVETIARGLARRLIGRTIEWVYLERSDVVHGDVMPICAALHGRCVEDVTRQGKRLRFAFDGPFLLDVHLGMSGRLIVADRDAAPEPHTHLRVSFRGRRFELRFCDPRRFGGLWLINTDGPAAGRWIGRRLPAIGEDPLCLTARRFRQLLDCRRQLKPLLLDQQPISGIGNIYCDEILHRAQIHPLTRASDLSDTDRHRLRRAMRRVLTEAIRAGGSSISDYRRSDNTPGEFQRKHRVYARAGQPCRRCGATIEKLTVAGRGTYICPRCQSLHEIYTRYPR